MFDIGNIYKSGVLLGLDNMKVNSIWNCILLGFSGEITLHVNKDSIKVSGFVIETQEVITGYHNYCVFFFLRKDIDSLIIGNIYEAKISQDHIEGC